MYLRARFSVALRADYIVSGLPTAPHLARILCKHTSSARQRQRMASAQPSESPVPRAFAAVVATSSSSDEASASAQNSQNGDFSGKPKEKSGKKGEFGATTEESQGAQEQAGVYQFTGKPSQRSLSTGGAEEAQRSARALRDFDESCQATVAEDGVYEFKRSRTMEVAWPARANISIPEVVDKLHEVIKQLLGRACELAEVIAAVRSCSSSKIEVGFVQQEVLLQLLHKPLELKGHSLRLSSIAVANLRKVFIKGISAEFPFSVIA